MSVVTISKEILKNFVEKIFLAEGVRPMDAEVLSNHLVLANLRGVDSHGVSRVKNYIERLRSGNVEKGKNFIILKETPVSCLIDGNNSMGILVATEGMRIAVEKAQKTGIGIVAVNNSNHCGMLADYVKYAADRDCIAVATTNAPSSMAPWGGKEGFFGTNPFAYGLPSGNENPIVFDMATSVVARGKIRLAQKNDMKIPIGWAISKDGKQTEDPNVALDGGSVLPVGGPKGYGLSFFVEVLSSILSGASFGPHIGSLYNNEIQNVGHFFIVFKADLFTDLDIFKARMNQMSREIKNISLAEGFERIYLPGELEFLQQEKREKEGIPLPKVVETELKEVAKVHNINY